MECVLSTTASILAPVLASGKQPKAAMEPLRPEPLGTTSVVGRPGRATAACVLPPPPPQLASNQHALTKHPNQLLNHKHPRLRSVVPGRPAQNPAAGRTFMSMKPAAGQGPPLPGHVATIIAERATAALLVTEQQVPLKGTHQAVCSTYTKGHQTTGTQTWHGSNKCNVFAA